MDLESLSDKKLDPLDRLPTGVPVEGEDIYALTDREVFHRVWRRSIKEVVYYGLGFLFILAVGYFYHDGAKDLTYLYLLGSVILTLIVLFVLLTTIVLVVGRLFSKRFPHQTRYDIGAAVVRSVELIIIVLGAYFLYFRYVK
ncbi:MAG TPA: hypothetical protein VHE60_15520 [Pyrinomonadaceae bacterium]|nr:hypothetical protein [Pyrinomonadaceae bacterium]